MPTIGQETIASEFERDGVIVIRQLLTSERVDEIRQEVQRYIRDDLPTRPADARTLEPDGHTVRNLWRLEQYSAYFRAISEDASLRMLVGRLLRSEPVLTGVETFNKPARVGSAVPWHQDNAYFCRQPANVLTLWIAVDEVTRENGPIRFLKGSHLLGHLPTRNSGVRGNSVGLAEPPKFVEDEQLVATLAPGDATVHHCQTVHCSAPNRTERSRLGLLAVYRGVETAIDERLQAIYQQAVTATPPA